MRSSAFDASALEGRLSAATAALAAASSERKQLIEVILFDRPQVSLHLHFSQTRESAQLQDCDELQLRPTLYILHPTSGTQNPKPYTVGAR